METHTHTDAMPLIIQTRRQQIRPLFIHSIENQLIGLIWSIALHPINIAAGSSLYSTQERRRRGRRRRRRRRRKRRRRKRMAFVEA